MANENWTKPAKQAETIELTDKDNRQIIYWADEQGGGELWSAGECSALEQSQEHIEVSKALTTTELANLKKYIVKIRAKQLSGRKLTKS